MCVLIWKSPHPVYVDARLVVCVLGGIHILVGYYLLSESNVLGGSKSSISQLKLRIKVSSIGELSAVTCITFCRLSTRFDVNENQAH
jgi:hypothetical protein